MVMWFVDRDIKRGARENSKNILFKFEKGTPILFRREENIASISHPFDWAGKIIEGR